MVVPTLVFVQWTRTGTGTFAYDVATNWTPNGVPNDAGATIYDVELNRPGSKPYTVEAFAAYEINALELNANATLAIKAGSVIGASDFTVDQYLNNAGAIDVNGGANGDATLNLATTAEAGFQLFNSGAIDLNGSADAATLIFNAPGTTLDGGGVINLAGDAEITGGADAAFIENYDNTIQGGGTIDGANLSLNNDTLGTIDANAATALTIDVLSFNSAGAIETTGAGGLILVGDGDTSGAANIFANGSLIADGSGELQIDNAYVEGGGVVGTAAAGASILLDNATLNVGAISIVARSSIQTEAGTTDEIDGNVQNAGTILVANNSTLVVNADLQDAGTLKLDAGGAAPAATKLELDHGTRIEAGGRILLSVNADNAIVSNGSQQTLVNHGTISGAGTIGDAYFRLVNGLPGVIDADDAAGLTIFANTSGSGSTYNDGWIELTGAGVLTISGFGLPVGQVDFVNAGTIDAASATTLTFDDVWVNSGGGLIETTVAGAEILLDNSTISGCDVSIAAGGSLDLASGSTDAIENSLFNSGTIDVAGGDTLLASQVWANAGAIDVAGALDVVGGSFLTLSGGGTIDLSGSIQSNDAIGGTGGVDLYNQSDTIEGSGVIGDSHTFLYNNLGGIIDANDGSLLTIDTGSNQIFNAGTIELSSSTSPATSVTLAIDSDLDDEGLLTAASGGWIDASAGVSGAGLARINGSGELELGGNSSVNVIFSAAGHGILRLDDSATNGFYSSIAGFTANDTIDLRDVSFTLGPTAIYNGDSSQGELVVNNGTQSSSLHFLGNYSGSTFHVATDGHGGTLVTI